MEKRIMLLMVFALVILSSGFISAIDVSNCQDLDSADTTYNLINNLTADARCLNITANGVTLDGNGYTIYYAQASAEHGIYSDGFNDTTIKNVNLNMNVTTRTGGADGIELRHANNILIDNVNFSILGSLLSSSRNKGIYLLTVNNITINDVDVYTRNVDGKGIAVETDPSTVSGNIFIYNTFVSSISHSVFLNGANGYINNTVLENVTTWNMESTSGNGITWDPEAGIDSHINMTNVEAHSIGDALLMVTGSQDCYIKDSSFYAGDGYYTLRLYSNFGQNLYLTNVTYNESQASVGSPSVLHRRWYYQAYVNNTGGTALDQANVTAYNVTGDYEMNLTTDATGWTPIGILTEYIRTSTGSIYQTPHNIFASASGYPAMNHSVNISSTLNYLTDFFSLDSSPPTVDLDYPEEGIYYNYKNNFYFNGTATDPNGVDSCNLWGNWTGTWHLNQTLNPITSGVQFSTTQNLTDGVWSYNFECNDTTGSSAYNSSNVTFIVDTTYPIIDPNDIDITTQTGSQTVPFNVTAYTEINCNNTFYSVFDSLGAINNGIENVSLSCSEMNSSFTVSDYATYNLTVYMRDKAGNEDFFSKSFTTVEQTGGIVSGGGGGGTIIIREKTSTPAENFTIVTTNFNTISDMVLAKGSKASRSKTFMIINTGIEPIEVELLCDSSATLDENQTAILNQSSDQELDICDYVIFEDTVVTVSPNEDSPTLIKVHVQSPDNNISFGDKYPFNIIGNREIDEYTSQYSKLSVTTRFPMWALVFKHSYIPFQDKVLEDGNEADLTTYPIFWVALFLAFLFFALPVVILRKTFLVTGLLIGFGLFVLTLILGLVFL